MPLALPCPPCRRCCRMVAVSHGYAWECQTQEGGWGLHEVFQEAGWKLRGACGPPALPGLLAMLLPACLPACLLAAKPFSLPCSC